MAWRSPDLTTGPAHNYRPATGPQHAHSSFIGVIVGGVLLLAFRIPVLVILFLRGVQLIIFEGVCVIALAFFGVLL